MNSNLLQEIYNILSRLTGGSGSVLLGSGATKTGHYRGFIVNSALTIAAITSSDPDMQSFVGTELAVGTLVTVAEGHAITSIESTSGTAVLYK